MKTHHVYLQFEDGSFGLIPENLENATSVYSRYNDPAIRQRAGIKACWVMTAIDDQLVLGTKPPDWSPKCPVRTNFGVG